MRRHAHTLINSVNITQTTIRIFGVISRLVAVDIPRQIPVEPRISITSRKPRRHNHLLAIQRPRRPRQDLVGRQLALNDRRGRYGRRFQGGAVGGLEGDGAGRLAATITTVVVGKGVEGEVEFLGDFACDAGEAVPDVAGVVADVDAVVDGEDGAFGEGVDFGAAADEVCGYGGGEEVFDGVA